jgi:UDP-N-acetylglucosamine 2-epimerase (non-hydrolysing)
MKIVNVVGARPNFMKIAPLMAEYRKYEDIEPVLVHTGQHYDEKMSDLFFRQLEIPEPDVNLGVGSASHAVQTAKIMKAFETVCLRYKPEAVLVVGDVNSTIACGLTAVKMGIKLIHVEAGLRSGDRSMPEEINRILTDAISNLLFCTEQNGVDNLLAGGVEKEKIYLVGNVMIDTLVKSIEKARQSSNILEELKSRFDLDMDSFAVMTLHRPANVDDTSVFTRIVNALEVISGDMPVVFPVHPRTRRNIEGSVIGEQLTRNKNICMVEPLGYFDFLKLMSSARIMLTDSGGIQEETTVLKIPCITLRDNTERPVTVEIGSNQVAGTKTETILAAYRNVMDGKWREPKIPPLWDGQAAERIVKILKREIPQH